MLVHRSLADITQHHLRHCCLTIGSFDGVHQGHRQLISRLQDLKKRGPVVVLTFSPPPAQFFSPQTFRRLFSEQDQIDTFSKLGVDHLFLIPFNHELSELSAEQFIEDYLWKPLQPDVIVVGYDFAFGKDRRGHQQLLEDCLRDRNVQVLRESPVQFQGEIVSSRALRSLVQSGDVVKVAQFLARPYYLQGRVVNGKRLGTQLGVPTANLLVTNEIIPASGVYVATVDIKGVTYKAVGNIGINPTVDQGASQKIEFHILSFSGDLYGSVLRFHLHEKLRDEMKFPSLEALKAQIRKDIEKASSLNLPVGT